MSKFQYAPGLPGYGTQGADGSNGLLGISTYFSEYSGANDSIAINTRIASNLELTEGSSDTLPGYPSRKYQKGDIFIDPNGMVYIIDPDGVAGNLYSATGQRLNTSTIFIQGVDTELTDPIYTRYSNSYATDKFLVDNVFSESLPGDYTQSPATGDGIYGLPALNYAQIKYVDLSVNGYLPYTVWNNTVDTGAPKKAIALVKEYGKEHWRWGNDEHSSDVSLSLDFGDVYIAGTVHATIDGAITTNNLDLPGWLEVGGEVIFNDTLYVESAATFNGDVSIGGRFFVDDIATFYDDIFVEGELNVAGESNFDQYVYMDADLEVDGTITGDLTGNADTATKLGTSTIGGAARGIYLNSGTATVLSADVGSGIKPVYMDNGTITVSGSTVGSSSQPVYMSSGTLTGITSLDVTGKVDAGTYLQAADYLYVVGDGTAAAPNIRIGSTNNGLYQPATNQIGFSIAGQPRFRMVYGSSSIFTAERAMTLKTDASNGEGYGMGMFTGDSSLDGGDIYLRAGDVKNGSGNYNGGNINIEAGDGVGNTDGGEIKLLSGISGGTHSLTGNITISTSNLTSSGTGDIIMDVRNNSAPSPGNGHYYMHGLSPGTGDSYVTYGTGSSYTSGRVYRSVSGPSDERLKDIDSSIINVLDKILNINPFYFTWNEFAMENIFINDPVNPLNVGISAQELEQYFPEIVKEFKGEDGENYKRILYDRLPVISIQAIKEQQTQIEELKAKDASTQSIIESLISRIEALENI